MSTINEEIIAAIEGMILGEIGRASGHPPAEEFSKHSKALLMDALERKDDESK